MEHSVKRPWSLAVIAGVVFLLGGAMVVYWTLWLVQGTPLEGIPVLSELLTAALALVTAVGLLGRRRWSLPLALVLAGMWSYGVIAGIAVVLQHGLDFSSPFGAITDAVLFPLVLVFALYMAVYVWRHRELLQRGTPREG
jgi:hypothetical protein